MDNCSGRMWSVGESGFSKNKVKIAFYIHSKGFTIGPIIIRILLVKLEASKQLSTKKPGNYDATTLAFEAGRAENVSLS